MREGGAAGPGTPGRRVVISVHDVGPSNLAAVRWLLDRLDALGVGSRVLKVIPNESGRAPIAEDRDLVALLREEAAHGSEIVLHGYTHRVAGALHGSALDRLKALLFAGGSAEFLSLSKEEAAERVEAGQAALEEVGLHPIGFCAPGWLGDGDLRGLLRQRGFRYCLTFAAVHDLRRGARWTIPAVGYMGAGPIQERLVGVERALVVGGSAALPVLRVFLHPQGAERSAACAAVLGALERLLRRRTPVSYAALLGA